MVIVPKQSEKIATVAVFASVAGLQRLYLRNPIGLPAKEALFARITPCEGLDSATTRITNASQPHKNCGHWILATAQMACSPFDNAEPIRQTG